MIPDLEIKILFCYSPQVLHDTYDNLEQLIADNQGLCDVTEDILRQNITTYNVKITKLEDLEIGILQKQWGMIFPSLLDHQIQGLAMCTLSYGCCHNLKFGKLPQNLLILKDATEATVVVLQTVLYDENLDGGITQFGVSSKIGINSTDEAFIAIGRKAKIKGQTTHSLLPTILVHELGHLMGCKHPKGDSPECDNSKGDSHGVYLLDSDGDVVSGTIMSYAPNKVLYFSNPTLYRFPPPYQNVPCGVVGESEAYKMVNANIKKLAGIFN